MRKVYVSTVIDTPIDEVWAVIRDFNGLPKWMPGIKGSEIEGGGAADSIGAVRVMDIGSPGAEVREELVALDDDDHLCTYSVITGPLPVESLVASIRLRPITDAGKTFGEWTADVEPKAGFDDKAVSLVEKVFGGGWRSLKEHLAG